MRRWKIGKAIYAYTDETTWDGPDIADDETVEVVEADVYEIAIARVAELESAIDAAVLPTAVIADARDLLIAVLNPNRRPT